MKFDRDAGDPDIIEVLDANGVLIRYCVRGETDTGIVVVYTLDHRGRIQVDENGDLLTRVERRPFPLILIRGDA